MSNESKFKRCSLKTALKELPALQSGFLKSAHLTHSKMHQQEMAKFDVASDALKGKHIALSPGLMCHEGHVAFLQEVLTALGANVHVQDGMNYGPQYDSHVQSEAFHRELRSRLGDETEIIALGHSIAGGDLVIAEQNSRKTDGVRLFDRLVSMGTAFGLNDRPNSAWYTEFFFAVNGGHPMGQKGSGFISQYIPDIGQSYPVLNIVDPDDGFVHPYTCPLSTAEGRQVQNVAVKAGGHFGMAQDYGVLAIIVDAISSDDHRVDLTKMHAAGVSLADDMQGVLDASDQPPWVQVVPN